LLTTTNGYSKIEPIRFITVNAMMNLFTGVQRLLYLQKMINSNELNTMHIINSINVMKDMNLSVMQSTGDRITDEFETKKNSISNLVQKLKNK
jgi:hypothetical protein